MLEKITESNLKIRFPDCDPFNHLNNSKYIDYMINAREDQLLKYYNFDIYKIAKETGLTWVVGQTQISYQTSAILMENVTIQCQLLKFEEKRLLLEAIMWNEGKTNIKAVMWMHFIHFNLITQKSQVHSKELIDFFTQIENPLKENITFDERISELKQFK